MSKEIEEGKNQGKEKQKKQRKSKKAEELFNDVQPSESKETEETKKEVVDFFPQELPEGQEGVDYLIYKVQGKDAEGNRAVANVAWAIPKTEEEAQARGVSLDELRALGVRFGLATSPNYQLEFVGRETNKEGKVVKKGYIDQSVVEACQKLADEYVRGKRGSASAATAEAKKLDAIRKEGGLSFEETQQALRDFMAKKAAESEG